MGQADPDRQKKYCNTFMQPILVTPPVPKFQCWDSFLQTATQSGDKITEECKRQHKGFVPNIEIGGAGVIVSRQPVSKTLQYFFCLPSGSSLSSRIVKRIAPCRRRSFLGGCLIVGSQGQLRGSNYGTNTSKVSDRCAFPGALWHKYVQGV